MINRKRTIFIVVCLAWTVGVAAFGLANMPKGVVPYALAHAPGSLLVLGVLWGLTPAFPLLSLAGEVARLEPLAGFFRRLIKPRRPRPPDRRRWAERILFIFAPVLIALQTFQTVGLVLYWRRRAIPAVAKAVHSGPHFYGYPDPHHWLLKATCIASLVLIAWFGNGLPKLMSPFRGEAEPYDWSKMMRDCGRVIAAGALIDIACLLFLPFPLGFLLGASVIIACFIVAALIWAASRIGGRPTRLTPPGQTP